MTSMVKKISQHMYRTDLAERHYVLTLSESIGVRCTVGPYDEQRKIDTYRVK